MAEPSPDAATSDRAEGTFFCFLKVEGLILWKTEDKALPEEKRDEDSGKLMLTGRSLMEPGTGPFLNFSSRKQPSQTLAILFLRHFNGYLFREQFRHTILPQAWQWWRLTVREKSQPQFMHIMA